MEEKWDDWGCAKRLIVFWFVWVIGSTVQSQIGEEPVRKAELVGSRFELRSLLWKRCGRQSLWIRKRVPL